MTIVGFQNSFRGLFTHNIEIFSCVNYKVYKFFVVYLKSIQIFN